MPEKPLFFRVCNLVTNACTLNCKLCIVQCPKLENLPELSLEFVNAVTDKAFEMFDFEIFEFTGGEPLMRNDLHDVLTHALRYIENVKTEFRLITNGTIVPSSRVLDALAQYGNKVLVLIANYGKQLSVNCDRLIGALEANNIRYKVNDYHGEQAVQYFGGWVDFELSAEPKQSPEKAQEIFEKCACVKMRCFPIYRGSVSICNLPMVWSALYKKDAACSDLINLFDESLSIEQKRKKLLALSTTKTCLLTCRHCNGMTDESIRYSAAEQL